MFLELHKYLTFLFFLVKMSTYDENESKFLRKAKENPFVPVGEYILCPNGYIMKRGKKEWNELAIN